MQNYNFFVDFLRTVLADIDGLVFSLLGWVIEGIFNLSTLNVNTEFVKTLYTRVYVLLSVFMVFKLSFSFLKYLVSPDAMTDKEQGVGKLVGRIVTMIVMLIVFPIVAFQGISSMGNRTILQILQDGVITTLPRVILGTGIKENTNDEGSASKFNVKTNGEQLALSMLKSFYYPSVCPGGAAEDEKYASACNEYFSGGTGSVEMEVTTSSVWSGTKGITEIDSISDFKKSVNEYISGADGKPYAWRYMWPLTTITGILLIVVMLGISIDVATRAFKLLILEVMAPVPIMSYIDPKASKDGSFSTWLKSFVSTYVDLFVKLGSVYLVLLLASALFNDQLFGKINLKGLSWLYVRVFLVIGLFQFAKNAPKFIKDALGIKDSGGGFMDSLKTLGAAAGLAGGAVLGGIGGMASGIAAAKASGSKNPLTYLNKFVGGGLAGIGRGGINGAKGAAKGNPFAGASSALAAQNAVTQRKITAAAGGSTFLGRTGTRASEFFTGQTAADRDQTRLDDLEMEKEMYDRTAQTNGNLYDYIMDKGAKQGALTAVDANLKDATGAFQKVSMSYDTFNSAYQEAKQNGQSSFWVTAADGNSYKMDTFSGDTAKFASDLQEASAIKWAEDNSGDAMLQRYEREAGVTNGGYTSSSLKDTKKNAEADSRSVAANIYNIKSSKGYKANKANAAAINKNGK